MHKLTRKVTLIILAMFIIPIMSVSSQDEYILHTIKKSEPQAFTQGLELNDEGLIVMGTGLYGESAIGYLNPETGHLDIVDFLDDKFFGEGITFTPDVLWQLTWKENIAFKRDPQSLEIVDEVTYEGQGWGLAYDDDREVIWMSDGSHVIQKRAADSFDLIDTIEITLNNQKVENINELEYANGYLYANIWYTNKIIAIDLTSGEIEYQYDMTDLLSEQLSAEELDAIDTLNGIAHIEDNRFYITGKLYPKLFEVELIR